MYIILKEAWGMGEGKQKEKKRWIFIISEREMEGWQTPSLPFPTHHPSMVVMFQPFFFSFYKLNVIKFEIYYIIHI